LKWFERGNQRHLLDRPGGAPSRRRKSGLFANASFQTPEAREARDPRRKDRRRPPCPA
jgi:hypothetical protein